MFLLPAAPLPLAFTVLPGRAVLPARPLALAPVQPPCLACRRSPPPCAKFGCTLRLPSLDSLDAPLGFAGWAIIAAYQFISNRYTARWSSQNAEARAVWTRYILEKGDYILGVQTLRNGLTSASFFSSACFTTLSLLIGLASRKTLSFLELVKYGSTSLLLVAAALAYLQSVRYMNTVAFLFQVANDQRDEGTSRGTVMLLMVLSHHMWTAGERMLYLLVPSVAWLVGGGPAMFAVSLAILPVLYFKDLPAPTNLLAANEPSLAPYGYLRGPFKFLDIFGFNTALEVAQQSVAKSGEYALQKYGLESAQWPPQCPIDEDCPVE